MADVDYSNAPREQRKAYQRITRGAGKGDGPRSCYSREFRTNFDHINWKHDKQRTKEAQQS